MTTIRLEAEKRADIGKGASRRLRRLENKVPAIVYGGGKEAVSIHLAQHKLKKAMENQAIYSSMLDLDIDGKVEHVILKALQRHPFKPVILHMDLMRVSAQDMLVKMVPVHFINENTAKGVKAGGIVNHAMSQIEVRCKVKDLPEFIEVDIAALELDGVIHLSELKLPKGVKLAADVSDHAHDHPVVSIHLSRAGVEEAAASEDGAPVAPQMPEATAQKSGSDEA